LPLPDDYYITHTKGAIGAAKILYVGVPPIKNFGYRQIRGLASKALSALAEEKPRASHIVMTIHGVGYGLDETEAFDSLIAGLVDAARDGDYPPDLTSIAIVDRDIRRAERLQKALADILPVSGIPVAVQIDDGASTHRNRLRAVGYDSDSKPHVFAVMPFTDDMDDVYHYGIKAAVNDAGYLCERADLSSFTGDVMEWVKQRIASASLVIADLTTANPNVYLEVGYAWGRGIPTVLIVRDTDELKFDTRSQRCLPYKKIKELEASLRKELLELDAGPSL
jgi:hypothetical protein